MRHAVYLSNVAANWSIERQNALLTKHVPDLDNVPIYQDVLPPKKRMSHLAGNLTRRNEMLRPTSRPDSEIIYVASLACLAWENLDFLRCLAAASARQATILALDTGRRISPEASSADVVDAATEFTNGRRAKTGSGKPGHVVSVERRQAVSQKGAKKIENRWRLPSKDYPTLDLLAEAGISRNTANLYLGNRPEAQRKHHNRLARYAK